MDKPADRSENHPTSKPWTDVVFSLAGGFVWASWPGSDVSIKLGEHEPVSAMMQDFLDQNALGARMERNAGTP